MTIKKQLLAVICCLGLTSLASGNHSEFSKPADNKAQSSFTLLNWNAFEMGENQQYPFVKIREVLLSHQPDIVTLQEVKSCSKGFYHLLRPNIDFEDASMWCAQSQAYPGEGEGAAGSYGVGIASLMVPQSDKVFSEINGRTVLGSRYRYDGQFFWVWTAHAAFVTSETDANRKEDFEDIVSLINRHAQNEPVILTGDLNANRDVPYGDKDPEYGDMDVFFDQRFKDVWRELYPTIEQDPGYSYYNDRRIDYVLVRDLPEDWVLDKMKLVVMDNPWCKIGSDNQSNSVNCSSEQAIDHNPLLLKVDTGRKG